VLFRSVREVTDDLKERGYRARNVTVKIRFNDFTTRTRAMTLEEPADSMETIRKAAFSCLGRFELTKKVRLVGVRLGMLSSGSPT